MQIALVRNAIIAKRNQAQPYILNNLLIYMDFISENYWHAECTLQEVENSHSRKFRWRSVKMNITLSVLNAAALVALVTFHFQDDGSQAQSVAIQPQPHHLLRQAPQLAIMSNQRHESAMVANESDTSEETTQSGPRWVF